MEDDDDVRRIFEMDDALDLLLVTGYRKAVCSLTQYDCSRIINSLIDYHLLFKVKSEMDQYREGLRTFGLLEKLKKDSELWKPFFVYQCNDLTPGRL